MKVRTRIAPSPTGDPHVGTAYIALFNLCFARQHGGKFILRIEDTDQVRSTRESEDMILEALRWTGLEWDEGPDVGGPHGPYRQSERSELYKEHAQILLDKGHAFRCFCTQERLDTLRKEQMAAKTDVGYDGHCMGLSQEEIQEKLDAGVSHVVRMKVPREGVCVVNDMLRDPIEIAWSQVDMQVLLKSDGLPTYHLANVVDDHFMEISHVMRGEEWINSAPKHLLLYKYFGWEAPTLCHMPLLRNPDKSKLSKRKNPTSILFYERMGYLPEALVNYLGMMGWSMPDEREKFSLAEMIEHFDITRMSLGGPVFDIEKLGWLNGKYIREEMDTDGLVKALQKWAFNEDYLKSILPLIQRRLTKMSDFGPLVMPFFSGLMSLTPEDFAAVKRMEAEATKQALQFGLWRLEALRTWDEEHISEELRTLSGQLDLKLRDFLQPFFIAIGGSLVGTPLFQTMEVLGPDLSRARLRDAVKVLGGYGNKKLKKLQKEYDRLATKPAAQPTTQG